MFKQLLLPALLLTAGTASAQNASQDAGKQVTIPFVGSGNVRNFEASRSGDGIYIQSFRGDWYFARFYGLCLDLPHASTIGFKTFSSLSLDRGDTILVGGQGCGISSIVRSGPPPKRPQGQSRS